MVSALKKLRLICGFAVLGAFFSPMQNGYAADNCIIYIDFFLKNGETSSREYSSHEKNKAACAKVAKLHNENFSPQAVKKKSVNYKWVANEKK